MERPLNIMLVDDDDICILISRKIAMALGCFKEITSASNGKEALGILEHVAKGIVAPPDIILLDLNMPVMDGFAFVNAFHHLQWENKAAVSIVVLTSSDHSRDISHAHSLGIDHYLIKPITRKNLESLVYSLHK